MGDIAPRSVTLPAIGVLRVRDDTRRLRRLLRPVDSIDPMTGRSVVAQRARVLFATVSRHGSRWYVSLNVEGPDFHAQRRWSRWAGDADGFVGVDRGLATFAVAATADGAEVGRWNAPRPLARRLGRLRRASKRLSLAKPGSFNRGKAARRLSREHARIANVRRSFLHRVSSQLAKTHSKLVIEDLAVANLIGNRRLARAISDAGWAEFARQLTYKADWFGVELVVCDRWFASTKTCRRCATIRQQLGLAERVV